MAPRPVPAGRTRREPLPVIFLIRHAEMVGNTARIVQSPDSPLSRRGIVQAERLARRLAAHGIASC